MSERQEFLAAVAQIPAPKHRAHELHKLAIETPYNSPEPWPKYFLSCIGFLRAPKEEVVAFLEGAGISFADTKLDWRNGCVFQFIRFPPATAERERCIIAGLKFRDFKIEITLARKQVR